MIILTNNNKVRLKIKVGWSEMFLSPNPSHYMTEIFSKCYHENYNTGPQLQNAEVTNYKQDLFLKWSG